MPNLSIKDVPEDWAQALRQRAASHHRSLQGELMAILEQALEGDRSPAPPRHSGKTLEEVFAELRRKYPKPVRGQPLGVDIIRQDRDSR